MATIEAGQLSLVLDGSTILLLNNTSFVLTEEAEVSELKGTGTTLAPVQVLYSYQRSKTYKVTMSAQYMNKRLSDFLEFGIIKRQSKTVTIPGYKHITTASTGTTTVTLPVGAVAKAALYYKIGQEHLVVEPADFNTTVPAAPVITGHLGKDLLIIYHITDTAEVANSNLDASYKPVSSVFSCNGKILGADGVYEYIEIPAMSLTKSPDQTVVSEGDADATEVEFSVLSTGGSPYYKVTLTDAMCVKLGL
jgi:hypothetical protein